ncbi:MAG TPA: helix-turn-helix domain-containing protein [Bacteroidota bacterium]|nr:helix-turn-helix domain-containing protein [Bacteroidota bacterium]
MDLISLLILFGIVQGFFLGIILILMRSANRRANRVLGYLFVCFSCSICHFFLLRTGLYDRFPFLLRASFPFLFLFGPLYYYYVRILTDRTVVLGKEKWLHGIPFVLSWAYNIPYLMLSHEEKLAYIHTQFNPIWMHMGMILGMVQVIHVFIYIYFILKILRSYDARIRDTASSIEKINLRWLSTGTIVFIAVFALIFVMVILQAIGIPTLAFYTVSIPVIVSIIIYALGYLGLRQPEIFSPAEIQAPVDAIEKKYERSSLTPERTAEYAGRITSYMEQHRPYLDAELTLPALAELLSIPPHHLSQTINSRFNSNFFDFVNMYRVEEAKRLLTDTSKSAYTILALAQDAGFNSKTAFNAAFKRLTGKTPSMYREKARIN